MPARRIAVTRPREDASRFVSALREHGHDAFALPVIEFRAVEPDPAWSARVLRQPPFDHVVFASARGVLHLVERLGDRVSALRSVPAACVGRGTARVARDAGFAVDLIPEVYDAEGLLQALLRRDAIAGRRFLVPRAAAGRDVLGEGLRSLGAAEVVDDPLYETVSAEHAIDAWTVAWTQGVDVVTLASPSTARALLAILSRLAPDVARRSRPVYVSIGPVTTAAAAELGLAPLQTAHEASFEGLVEACLAACRPPEEGVP